ncbi:MAG: response regulator transcription factor [Bacteroidetes bacterium]|nr:response regulator transcription factor [Bacteroidota bacterium]
MIRILVADDYEIIRSCIRQILSDEPDMMVTYEASNGQQVLDHLKQHEVDVVILDFYMPVLNGLEALLEIRKLYPALPVIMLSALSDSLYEAKTLKSGASGFIDKETVPEDLVNAIRMVLTGTIYVTPKPDKPLRHH